MLWREDGGGEAERLPNAHQRVLSRPAAWVVAALGERICRQTQSTPGYAHLHTLKSSARTPRKRPSCATHKCLCSERAAGSSNVGS